MNREIKFRAWYKEDNQMIDWFTLKQSAWNTFRGEKPLSLVHDVLVARKNDFDIMQFTGLQDKNGKDIYEGDIVKHSGIICKVVYGKKGACFSLFDVRLGETDLYVITELSSRYMEVIGNEFENPELLTPQS
jgi:uncharacterized phage protein (TIGR01671 family)